jgi:hydroxymethylpyrimidine kinase/phosphomethylpyrimidine kinase
VDAEIVREQLSAVLDDIDVAVIKTGVLATAAIVEVVAESLGTRPRRPLVVDPVVGSTDGYPLTEQSAIEPIKRRLVPMATLLTPNVPELQALTGRVVLDPSGAERAGRELLALGCDAVLVKGGHLAGPQATDLLLSGSVRREYTAERLESPHTHGTGCVYSAAIAAALARGLPLEEAVAKAKRVVTESIRHGLPLGARRGTPDPLHRLHDGDATTAARGESR